MNHCRSMFALVVGLVFVVGCSDESPYQPVVPTYSLSGTVYSEYCVWIHDYWFPYSDSLNLPARVEVIDTLTGDTFTTYTDSASSYRLECPTGVYQVQVESPHSSPWIQETVFITADTSIDIYSQIEWLWHDTIMVEFYYPPGDSLADAEELNLIRSLNSASGGILDTVNLRSQTINPDGLPNVWVEYYVPLAPVESVWMTEGELHGIVNGDPLTYPTSMYVHMRRFPCPATSDRPLMPSNRGCTE